MQAWQGIKNTTSLIANNALQGPLDYITGFATKQEGLNQLAQADYQLGGWNPLGAVTAVKGKWNVSAGNNQMIAGADKMASTATTALGLAAGAGLLVHGAKKFKAWKNSQKKKITDLVIDNIELYGLQNRQAFEKSFGKTLDAGYKRAKQREGRNDFQNEILSNHFGKAVNFAAEKAYNYGVEKGQIFYDIGMNYGKQLLDNKVQSLKKSVANKFDPTGKVSQKKAGIMINVQQKGAVQPRALSRIQHKAQLATQNTLMKL